MKEMKKVANIDVMVGDRFYCQLRYEYLPCFVIDARELERFVTSKRPELRGVKFTLACGERVSKR